MRGKCHLFAYLCFHSNCWQTQQRHSYEYAYDVTYEMLDYAWLCNVDAVLLVSEKSQR